MISASPAWNALSRHYEQVGEKHLREFFAEDPQRGHELALTVGDLYIDYSKHRVMRETIRLLIDLATAAGLEERRAAMFAGEHINTSEDRAVLQHRLRLPRDASLTVDGQDVVADVHSVLDAMGDFTDRLRSGDWRGATGERIKTVVNIGIGGSDLGPVMVYEALRHYADAGISARFVSNVDPADLVAKLDGLDPATNRFHRGFQDVLDAGDADQRDSARRWLTDSLGDAAVSKHFVAVSTNKRLVDAFGINTDNMFGFWDWVGGRYSVDSAIGLSVMAVIGREAFADFFSGLHLVDQHFRTAPLAENAPALLGLIGLWYSNFFGAQSRAVLPYSNDLYRFAAYLQQLTMESNGKSVRADGRPSTPTPARSSGANPAPTASTPSTSCCTRARGWCPRTSSGSASPSTTCPQLTAAGSMHDLLMSNFFAQTQVLAFGKTAEEIAGEGTPAGVVPHKVMPGNRPTTSILATRLTPVGSGTTDRSLRAPSLYRGRDLGYRLVRPVGRGTGQDTGQGVVPVLTGDASPSAQSDTSADALVRRYRIQRGRAG